MCLSAQLVLLLSKLLLLLIKPFKKNVYSYAHNGKRLYISSSSSALPLSAVAKKQQ